MYLRVSAGALALALSSSGGALAVEAQTATSGDAVAEATAGESRGSDGRRIFAPSFFTDFNPSTALDMVNQVPGFGIDEGSGARGLGGTGGNVLVDGSRPTAKDQSIQSILSAIPVAQVERIELLEGAAAGAAASGQSLVVNVVRKAGSRPTSAANLQLTMHENRAVTPEIELTHSRRVGPFTLELAAEYEYGEYVRLLGFEGFRDGQGRWLERGPNEDWRRDKDWSVRGSLNGTVGGTKASLNLQTSGGTFLRQWWHVSTLEGATAPFRVDNGRFDDEWTSWEAGGSLERTIGGWKVTLNGLANGRTGSNTDLAGFNRIGTAPRFNRFTSSGESSEQVVRLAAGRAFGAHQLEFGGEFARNQLEISNRFATGDGTAFTVVIDPRAINDTTVAEDRWEAFISDSWTISDSLTADLTLTGEWSTISQTGDARRERSFFYLKPRLSASWKPADGWTVRGRVERQLGQLDFGAFAFSTEVGDGRDRVGNTNLRPDQTIVSELGLERRWGQRGTASLTLVNEDITDAFATVPVDSNGDGTIDGEALGNLPSARRWGFQLAATLPLEALIPGLEVSINWRWRDAKVRDPLTGRDRLLDDWDGNNLNPSFVQRFPEAKWEWGAWAWMGSKSWQFSADQVLEWPAHDGWGVWARTTRFTGWTLEAGVDDPQGHTFRRIRTIYATDRRSPEVAREQYRERSNKARVYIEVRRDL
jgi:outer membrane receptor for ferrienterochelin and colicin